MFHTEEGLLPMHSPHLRVVGPKIRGGLRRRRSQKITAPHHKYVSITGSCQLKFFQLPNQKNCHTKSARKWSQNEKLPTVSNFHIHSHTCFLVYGWMASCNPIGCWIQATNPHSNQSIKKLWVIICWSPWPMWDLLGFVGRAKDWLINWLILLPYIQGYNLADRMFHPSYNLLLQPLIWNHRALYSLPIAMLKLPSLHSFGSL
jgi:hypothetical protein